MQEGGWIKLYRSIRKHWLWEDAEKLKWWIDILLQANHKDNKFLLGSELVVIERGSFHTSELKLSQRWGVSKTTIRKFLNLLEEDKMIEVKKSKKGTTIKVSNYEDYQSISEEEKTIKKSQKNHDVDNKNTIEEPYKNHNVDTNKNDKEYIKNDKEGEERKEGKEEYVPVLPSISFPNYAHKKIYDELSELSYRTWFINTDITETDDKVIVKAKDDFIRDVIIDKYKDKLNYMFLKNIEVIKGE